MEKKESNSLQVNISYETLFKAIRARCQRDHWFGPEQSGPTWRKRIAADNPHRFGFVFPPASEEQVWLTEERLGFPLPPLLRALYTGVANGGFGPGGGLKGIVGGYGSAESGTRRGAIESTVDQYLWRSHKDTIDLAEYETQWTAYRELLLPYGEWPEQLLPICDLGCVQEACVDSKEQMFFVAPIDSNELYCLVQMPWTFDEWLWRWVKDEDLIMRYAKTA